MTIVNIGILAGAAIMLLAALISLVGAFQARGGMSNQPYGVGQQESRRSMQVALLRSAVFGVIALILFAVYGLNFRPDEVVSVEPEAEFTAPPSATASMTPELPTGTPTLTATAGPATLTPTATTAPPTPTDEPTATPSITPTPIPTAVVNVEVGLYLRDVPGGTAEIELLENGTVLTLLPGLETVDGEEWQEVRAPSGNEGWVAVQFIEYQQ